MIVRIWRGESTVANGSRYVEHLEQSVFPQLRGIPGHRGAEVLRRTVDDRVEFIVMTRWDSMEAVRQFAGAESGTAVVEPAARAVLSRFDRDVDHFEVAAGTIPLRAPASAPGAS